MTARSKGDCHLYPGIMDTRNHEAILSNAGYAAHYPTADDLERFTQELPGRPSAC